MKTIKTIILTLLMIFACNAFNMLNVDDHRYWVRDIDSMYFSADRDTMYVSGFRILDTFIVNAVDTMYFSDTGYVPRTIPAGVFYMGHFGEATGMIPWRETVVSRAWYMDATEVTQGEFKRLMGVCPSDHFYRNTEHFVGDSLPVWGCTLYDAALYCNARSKAEGLDTVYLYDSIQGVAGDSGMPMTSSSNIWLPLRPYAMDTAAGANGWRLPPEYLWEYAARCGAMAGTGQYWWGTPQTGMDCDSLWGPHGWYVGNADGVHHAPARKQRSPWGLYDMHGNVGEWCSDIWGNWYLSEPLADPARSSHLTSKTEHTVRGGNIFETTLLPVYFRQGVDPQAISEIDIEGWGTGFRCVRPVE